MLTLLTATGCRPKAWAICEKLMMAQTYKGPVHWIIVDDGEIPQPIIFQRNGWRLTVVRPTPYWEPKQNTQARNLLAGCDWIGKHDKVVVIEDDDAYTPNYLATVDKWLEDADIVGEIKARYYNLPKMKYRQLNNTEHASLCSTAFAGHVLDEFRAACMANPKFIDLHLWRHTKWIKGLHDTRMVVGMKGLPGRGGIGMGHRADFQGKMDSGGYVLTEWLGKNAALYKGLV